MDIFCHRNKAPALCFTRICRDTDLELYSVLEEGFFSSVSCCVGIHAEHLCKMKMYSYPNAHFWTSLGMSKLWVKPQVFWSPYLKQQGLCDLV